MMDIQVGGVKQQYCTVQCHSKVHIWLFMMPWCLAGSYYVKAICFDLVQRSCGNISPKKILSLFSLEALLSVYSATRCQKPQNHNPVLYRYLKPHSAFINTCDAKHTKSHNLHVAVNISRNLEILIYRSTAVCNIVMSIHKKCHHNLSINLWLSQGTNSQTHTCYSKQLLIAKRDALCNRNCKHPARSTSNCSFSHVEVQETNMKERAVA
jgi:hypothetical protein